MKILLDQRLQQHAYPHRDTYRYGLDGDRQSERDNSRFGQRQRIHSPGAGSQHDHGIGYGAGRSHHNELCSNRDKATAHCRVHLGIFRGRQFIGLHSQWKHGEPDAGICAAHRDQSHGHQQHRDRVHQGSL